MNILFIGYGVMGSAIGKVMQKSHCITCIDPSHPFALKTLNDLENSYIPEIIIIALKPTHLERVLPFYSHRFNHLKNLTWISIAAGIKINKIQSLMPKHHKSIRAMPNLPFLYQQGITTLFSPLGKSEEINALFSLGGKVLWVDLEEDIDKATAISGSGPSYFYLITELLNRAALRLGLSHDQADLLARQTIIGAGEMIKESNLPPSVLRENVSSKGGTTEAALSVLLDKDLLESLITKAVEKAYQKAQILGSS